MIAPLLVFWWGFGMFPKLVVIALICFFPVLVTTVDGLAAVDPEQPKLLRTLDASRWQAFRFAELPAALPAALSGARIALAVGVIGAFIAESQTATIGPTRGSGARSSPTRNAFQTPRAYAAAAVLFAFAIACFYALALAERRLAPWSTRPEGDRPLEKPRSPRRRTALAAPRALACALALSALRHKAGRDLERRDQALHRDARLVPQRRPRGAVHGDRRRQLPRGRTGRAARWCPPKRPNR